jgi:phosphatidylserine/phosphatidylglycerophosphate/cardiolipin synthase-like enzyme
MGSANINDRSMLGARDSEIDVIVEDEEQLHATLNGQATTVARKVRELRVQLMQEHLGLLHLPASDPAVKMLLDPTPDAFYHDVLRQQAARNTQIYRELFHCVPDDCVDTWEEYRRFTEIPRAHVLDEKLGINSLEMLDAIKGSVVLYPTHFLRKEDLAASLLTPEFLLPIEVYL